MHGLKHSTLLWGLHKEIPFNCDVFQKKKTGHSFAWDLLQLQHY